MIPHGTTFLRVALIAMLASCSGGSDDGPPPPDGPSTSTTPTSISWTIRRLGAPSTCAAVGADEIHVVATPEDGFPINHTFQCVLVPGSLPLAPGRYAIAAELYDGSGPQRLASSTPQPLTVPATGTPPAVQLVFDL